MEPLSVVIITRNEEKNIARCINSIRSVADEIVVLDSFSTDDTVDIARSMGAVVHQRKFGGYIQQKNRVLELAKYNYVLSLDADEALDETLSQSIAKTKRGFVFKAYKMNRRAFYCGKFIRHGTWYPETKTRLFDKRYLRWGGLDPHDRIDLPPTTAVCPLRGDILHYICETVEEHTRRNDNFSTLSARSMHRIGKKTNWFKIIASPTWFFIHDYLLRLGFLDGKRGWAIAVQQTRYHFLKYAKLYQLQKNRDQEQKGSRTKSLYIQPAANADRLPRDVGSHA